MRCELKKALEGMTPPLLMNALKSKFGSYGFSGNYSTWEEAKASSEGYDSGSILDKVKEALLKVKNGQAVYERDSVLFDEIEYSWPLLAALLWISSRHDNRLNLVDFGGSLGSSYFQNRHFLNHLQAFQWSVVEQKHFVECGRENFEDEHLKFYFDLDGCAEVKEAKVILFLSVIQYIEDPFKLLETVVNRGFQYIIFDRTPFLEQGQSRIAVQRVSAKINKASYPLWIFNFDEFIDFFIQHGYEVVAHFNSAQTTITAVPEFKGCIFKRSI